MLKLFDKLFGSKPKRGRPKNPSTKGGGLNMESPKRRGRKPKPKLLLEDLTAEQLWDIQVIAAEQDTTPSQLVSGMVALWLQE